MDKAIEAEAARPKTTAPHPLLTEAVPIDDHCTGDRWSAQDETQLAKLIAIIAMGQAAYAAYILKELLPATPAFADDDLRREAKVRLTVQEDGKKPRTGYPQWQRDGFIFEAISWIAARQEHGEFALLKDPHVSATSQGLDGLMIERELVGSVIPRGLSFVMGLVSHVVEEVNPFDMQEDLSRQLVECLGTAVRKGYDEPEKVSFAGDHPAVLSRVRMHELWTQQNASG